MLPLLRLLSYFRRSVPLTARTKTQPSEISENGLVLIRHFEGLRLQAYLCPAGVWTIGYGHTKNAYSGMTITNEHAELLLKEDLFDFQRVVFQNVKVDLLQNEFDALVSFCYNVGASAFYSSTLLKMLNEGDKKGASQQFSRWNKAKGNILPGLVRRREAEQKLFNGESWNG